MTRTVDTSTSTSTSSNPGDAGGTGTSSSSSSNPGDAGSSTEPRPYERLRPLMRLWYLWWLKRSQHVTSPRDEPTSRSDDPAADTVLLVGNGPAHGWGVATHADSLVGALARASAATTGRPCSVDLVGDEMMSLESTRAWLGDTDLGLYDAVVVMVGMNDAVRLTPLDVWERELRTLVATVRRRVHPTARAVLVGVPPVRSVQAFDAVPGRLAERHAERMNAITARLAAEADLTYFRLPAGLRREGSPHGSPETYRRWADLVTEHVAPVLDRVRRGELDERLERTLPGRDFAWSGGRRLVEQAATGGSETLQQLAKEAEREFGVDVAVVSLLDGSRLWYGMGTDVLPTSIPRELSFCEVTVAADDLVVVPDARRDERFADNPYLDVNHGWFYAGVPIHASTGEAIGSFCLHGVRPRRASSISADRLRAFAQRAEAELQTYEQAAPAAPPLTRRARREAEERAALEQR